MAAEPFLRAEGIVKTYGGAQALRGVDLTLHAGEVHGLAGANGAGKSTLIRVLAGLVQPDAGRILIDGAPVGALGPAEATTLGLAFIHQELAFVPGMTVVQNILLGAPKPTRFGLVDRAAAARLVRPVAEQVGIQASLDAPMRGLPVSEVWLVQIARALVRRARLIVMDEPTASLSAAEAERLFGIVRDLAAGGVAVLHVTHRLAEITAHCHRATVLRDGRRVAEIARGGLTREALVRAIVGEDVGAREALQRCLAGPVVLRVAGLRRGPVRDVTLEVHAGEVLGLGGLVGAGRSELARLIFGADRAEVGTMELGGAPYAPRSPADAVRAGVGLVPEERRSEGLILQKGIGFNLALSNLGKVVRRGLPLVSDARQRSLALDTIQALAIKAEGPSQPVARLSGGNQQKVVIGRWIARRPKLLILDEPTRGVDVGARAEIHRLIRGLAAEGMAVLAISSEPDELPDLCDRVLVMGEGRIVAELAGDGITRAAIVAASFGAGKGRAA